MQVCNQPTLAAASALFSQFASALKGCRIVYGDLSPNAPEASIERVFGAGAAVCSAFGTAGIRILDEESVRDMRSTGGATFGVTHSVSLDNQVVSYLEPYLQAGPASRLPKDFEEVLDFIARPDVQIDPIPYLTENTPNVGDLHRAERIYAKIRAYEILRTMDVEWYKVHGAIRSTQSTSEINRVAQQTVASMLRSFADDAHMGDLIGKYAFSYVSLLKMTTLQLQAPSAPGLQKLQLFIEFSDHVLGAISPRDILLAAAYFEQKALRERFFGKVQRKRKDIFGAVRGMAWDLWHVRWLELAMTLEPEAGARCLLPALLSFDRGLIEVASLCKLKAVAIVGEGVAPLSFFDVEHLINAVGERANLERLYSPASML